MLSTRDTHYRQKKIEITLEEKIYHGNKNHKKYGMAILISEKINITKLLENFYNDKETMHQENITTINICAANNRSLKHMK